MFEFADQWQTPINYLFLLVTGAIAWRGLRYRTKDGETDTVQLLFGCIAAVFFFMVLLQDVLGVIKFY
jgi:hypothetical protein